jgi:type II secretory pathway pseudopilin PulG
MNESHATPQRPTPAARTRRSARAFTLIELTVSLVAGLIVAMAVATLSHESTASFNEEVHISAAEATLRGAADRLRSDLQRASYMSTANIGVDPQIAKIFGQTSNLPLAAPAALQSLQGIQFVPGNSATNNLPLDTTNSITPNSLVITGNLSSADQFEVQSILPGTCCQINLAASSPAIFRMLNANDAGTPDPNASTEMQNIFAPAPVPAGGGSASFTKAQFLIRYVDTATSHAQFLLTCNNGGQQIAGMPLTGGVVHPYVLTATCPLTGAQTGTITATNGNTGGLATVNPVQTARWDIASSAGFPLGGGTLAPPTQDITALDNQSMATGDPLKYDLVRSLLDGNGNYLPETTEVVAEYAVHLDFAFSVDTENNTTGVAPTIVAYDFGNAQITAVAGSVLNLNANPVSGPKTPDPQRIRSVRFMIATRAGTADRSASIAPPTGYGAGNFLYRYCMNLTGCTGTSLLQWARVRTIVSEVSLPNQQQLFY